MSQRPAIPSDPNDLDWMELHLRCLYHHDANDRIVRTRQPNGWPSPLFHLGRTSLGNLWRFRDDLEPAAIRELARLAGRESAIPADGQHSPPERLEAMRSVLRSVTELVFEWRGPAFRFPAAIEEPPVGSEALPIVRVGPGGESLLEECFADSIPELAVRQPCLAAVAGDRAVSLCYAARPLDVTGSAASVVAEAGVETAAGHRHRGHARRVVAAWARAVREMGGEPIYSTSWDNKASRGVARALGLVFYGEDLHFS